MPTRVPMPRAIQYADAAAAEAAMVEFQREYHALVAKYGLLGNIVGYMFGFASPNDDDMVLVNSGVNGMDYVLEPLVASIQTTLNQYVANDDDESSQAYDFPDEIEENNVDNS